MVLAFSCYNVFNPSDTNFQLLECHYYVDIQHFYIRLFSKECLSIICQTTNKQTNLAWGLTLNQRQILDFSKLKALADEKKKNATQDLNFV